MTRSILPVGIALLGLVAGQKPNGEENHPKITTYRCTKSGGCSEATNYIVLDSSSHCSFPPSTSLLFFSSYIPPPHSLGETRGGPGPNMY